MAATVYERGIFRRRHLWTEFAVGSLPCSEMFFFWVHRFPLPLKYQPFQIPIRSGTNTFKRVGRLVPSRYLCVCVMREDWG